MIMRKKLHIITEQEANTFVDFLNSKDNQCIYYIEDEFGMRRVNARSILGVLYAVHDFNDQLYLVNHTFQGSFPAWVNDYSENF